MLRFFICLMTAALTIHLATATAFAQSAPDAQTQRLLRKLEALVDQPAGGAREATALRTGKVRVTINWIIAALPKPTHKMRCEVQLTHNNGPPAFQTFTEIKGQTFPLASGKCVLLIPFRFDQADPSGMINIFVTLRPEHGDTDRDPTIARTVLHTLPPIVVPSASLVNVSTTVYL